MKKLQLSASIYLSKPSSARDDYLLGRHYAVYPVVMLREGVHRGMSGVADYFESNVIANSVNSWAGTPITVNHPKASCGEPLILHESWIGSIYNPYYDEKNKALKAEAWIDKVYGASLLHTLANGKNIDVSVGVWGEFAEEEGKWNEETYGARAQSLLADHLAILPDGEGACSWEDGCGIRDYEEKMKTYIRSSARTPVYKGTETTSWADVKKTIQSYIGGYVKASGASAQDIPSRVQDLPAAAKRWIADKTLLGDPGADNERDLLFFPVVNPATNKLNADALRAVLGGRGSQADIPPAARDSAQAKARALLKEEFSRKEETMTTESLFDDFDEKNIEKVARMMKKQESQKKAPSCLEDALEAVAPEFRAELVESYKTAQEMRQGYIADITAASGKFCEKWLGTQALSVLKPIAELAREVLCAPPIVEKPSEEEEEKVPAAKLASYALQAAPQGQPIDSKYVPAPAIKWVN